MLFPALAIVKHNEEGIGEEGYEYSLLIKLLCKTAVR